MTPLRLELSGFTCFRAATDLDLSGLELFAIAGPTGSGKTTLLDAITYALYGETPRLGRQNLDALISPGENQLYVKLEFRTAQGSYRVVRTADRKPSGKVERNTRIFELDPRAEWRQLPESEKLREADAKLEELVGLDYDGFTRSVLLPQGAFDAFLRGDAGKRRKLLVGLLGLDRVETMQKLAGQRAREAEAEAKGLDTRLEQDYAGVSPERKRDLRLELEGVQAEQSRLEAQARALDQTLREQTALAEVVTELERVGRRLAGLAENEAAIGRKAQQAEAARRALPIAPLVGQFERALERAARLRQEAVECTETLEGASATQVAAQAALERLEREAETRLPALAARRTQLASLLPLVAQLKNRGGSLALAARAAPGSSYTDADWDVLQRLGAQVPQLRAAEEDELAARREVETARAALERLKGECEAASARMEEAKTQGWAVKARLEAAQTAFEDAQRRDRAATLRAQLHAGEPCPVCERVIERVPDTPPSDLPALGHALKAQETKLEGLKGQYAASKATLAGLEERLREGRGALERAETRRVQGEARLSALRAAFAAEGERANAQRLDERLGVRRTALLAALARDITAAAEGEDPDAAQRRIEAEGRTLENALKRAASEAQAARAAHERAEALLGAKAREAAEAEEDERSARDALEAALGTSGFAGLDALRGAHLGPAALGRLEAEVQAHASAKEAAAQREVELRAKLAGRTFDPARYQALQAEAETLAERVGGLQARSGALRRDLEHLEVQLERAAGLRAALRASRSRFETYRTLSTDLRGDAFQDYLLEQVQGQLARRASHILREVTGGRYDLHLVEGEYQVYDAWHAGEARHAKTLSGGETFIASLALALALSDTIAGRALGALFLDEGFGTLDADTLEAVTDVLQALTREGRMVGVITHVQSLTERLPARLSVAKGPEGSTVTWDLP